MQSVSWCVDKMVGDYSRSQAVVHGMVVRTQARCVMQDIEQLLVVGAGGAEGEVGQEPYELVERLGLGLRALCEPWGDERYASLGGNWRSRGRGRAAGQEPRATLSAHDFERYESCELLRLLSACAGRNLDRQHGP